MTAGSDGVFTSWAVDRQWFPKILMGVRTDGCSVKVRDSSVNAERRDEVLLFQLH